MHTKILIRRVINYKKLSGHIYIFSKRLKVTQFRKTTSLVFKSKIFNMKKQLYTYQLNCCVQKLLFEPLVLVLFLSK